MQNKALRVVRNIIPENDSEVDLAFKCFLELRESRVSLFDEFSSIIKCVVSWFTEHGSVPTRTAFHTHLQTVDPKAAKVLEQTAKFSLLSFSEFSDLLKIIKAEEEKQRLLGLLTDTVQIVSSQKTIEVEYNGRKKKVKLSGSKDGAKHLLGELFKYFEQAEPSTHSTSRATGELREEYVLREMHPESGLGILTGFESIDIPYRGMQPGDLCLVAGFAGHGKSTMVMNMAHTAMVLGYNVLFFTLEMSIEKCRRTLAVLHSAHSKFADVHSPVRYADVKNGTLSKDEREFYLETVLPDLDNPDYGVVWFEKPSSILTIDDLMTRAEVIHRQMEVDLIVIDYIGLIEGSRYQDFKDTLNHTIKRTKQWAMSFDNGRGVPILTPFQTNRHGLEAAMKADGVYEVSALSHASEAERSADMIVAIYAPDELRRVNEAKLTYLKFRDAETPPPRLIFADYSTRKFSDLSQQSSSVASLVQIPL